MEANLYLRCRLTLCPPFILRLAFFCCESTATDHTDLNWIRICTTLYIGPPSTSQWTDNPLFVFQDQHLHNFFHHFQSIASSPQAPGGELVKYLKVSKQLICSYRGHCATCMQAQSRLNMMMSYAENLKWHICPLRISFQSYKRSQNRLDSWHLGGSQRLMFTFALTSMNRLESSF